MESNAAIVHVKHLIDDLTDPNADKSDLAINSALNRSLIAVNGCDIHAKQCCTAVCSWHGNSC